ncbi:MAG: thioredoxin family protein [Planctomycetota bacterium]|jgi:thioredoxin-related protein
MLKVREGVAVLFLAALSAGEPEETHEVAVTLKAATPGETQLGYSSGRRMDVESTVPRFLFEIPEFQAKDPLFFRISLGETKGVPFYGALDRTPAGIYHDLLFIDKNRDLDLTNDGDPVPARVRTIWTTEAKVVEFLNVTLDLPYAAEGKEHKEPYGCVFFFFLDKGKKTPTTMLVERDCWREGMLTVDGKPYAVALVDDDSDGQYSTSDAWVMVPARAERKRFLHRDLTRSMLFPAWSEDQKWTVDVKKVDPAGRSATFRIRTARETERDFFVRVARQRQTAEERQLKLDPLRPKADQTDKVDWIENKDVKYARDIGNSPNVQRRVLLDFTSRTCPWCAKMYQYTFRDREVVQLSKRFVCAKIWFKPDSPDTKKYNVEGTPTYVVLDLNGAEIARHQGFLRPTEFAAWLKSATR